MSGTLRPRGFLYLCVGYCTYKETFAEKILKSYRLVYEPNVLFWFYISSKNTHRL